jgi:CheY-like chemotaxis protein
LSQTRRFKILAVEDDLSTRAALFSLLADDGFQVTLSRSAEEGLERLRTGPFDLVLTDFQLPMKSGSWMVSQARESGLLRATPVLMCTTDLLAQSHEGLTVIRKPMDACAVMKTVRTLLSDQGST